MSRGYDSLIDEFLRRRFLCWLVFSLLVGVGSSVTSFSVEDQSFLLAQISG